MTLVFILFLNICNICKDDKVSISADLNNSLREPLDLNKNIALSNFFVI